MTLEAVTHHAYDDYERMIKGDPGVEGIFYWDPSERESIAAAPGRWTRRSSAAARAKDWACTCAPARWRSAAQSRATSSKCASLDVKPRPCANPKYPGKTFGSNAAAWWGFHYKDLIEEPKQREVITIYEVDATGERDWAKAVYNFRWIPQTDPFGMVHKTIDYPGVPVDHAYIKKNYGILKNVRVPVRPHFGMMGLAPAEADMVDSIPPSYTGGNIDNWRIGKGATMYYPVSVPAALLLRRRSARFAGRFRALRHGHRVFADRHVPARASQEEDARRHAARGLNYPLLETQTEFVRPRLQLRELFGRARSQGAVRDLREVVA